ncbi:hypothetical protein KXR73_07010, partial [Micrococcus luteus]|uniref:hypothetical protein n=1 Tax=Micrococcus luteus TaxID=1270 RepID=UPI003F18FB59
VDNVWSGHRGDVLSRVLWKVRSKAPTVTASVSKMVVATGEGYTTIRDSTLEAVGEAADRDLEDAPRVVQ